MKLFNILVKLGKKVLLDETVNASNPVQAVDKLAMSYRGRKAWEAKKKKYGADIGNVQSRGRGKLHL